MPDYVIVHPINYATHSLLSASYKGHPLPYIAKIVGHSTIDTLIRHYARWLESSTQEDEKKLRQSFDMSAVVLAIPLHKKVGEKVGALVP